VTAVVAFRANADERHAAFPPQEARRRLAGICHDAVGGDRSVLVDPPAHRGERLGGVAYPGPI
jgi:hypothetical protein